jgi:geranylgeranyl pyrophosphate synthase
MHQRAIAHGDFMKPLALKEIVDERIRSVVGEVGAEHLRRAMSHALAGGKRMRPLMTMLTCPAVGGRERDALDAGVAFELLHTASLIHDDIMDGSETRRGRQTVHSLWGVPAAILTGDALIALAFSVLQRADWVRKPAISEAFSRAFLALCEGQSDDMAFSWDDGVDDHAHRRMVEKKTARLLEAATLIGALIGTTDTRLHRAMADFGLNIGMAYQAHDDLLDVVGSEQLLGKPIGVDARNGKKTFLTVRQERRDGVATVNSIVREYTQIACAALDTLCESPARESLRAIAGSLVGREM